MPYAIMRFKKTGTGGIAPAQKHNEREKTIYKSNPDIDLARTKDNYHIIKPDKPIEPSSRKKSLLLTAASARTVC